MADIKLIATDMDGTLLTDHKQLPPDFYALLRALEERDILFCVGSGRTYRTLRTTFTDVPRNLQFICDNGAFVVENGVNTFTSLIEPALWRRAATAVETQGPEVRTILCGQHGTYVHEYRHVPALKSSLEHSFSNLSICQDFSALEDGIFKVAVCDVRGAGDHAYPFMRELFGTELNVIHSAPHYLDLMNLGVSKGSALAHLQKERGITPQQTMVFGDYYNDIDMLVCGTYSFVMGNAEEDMFQYGNFRAPTNEQHGVSETILRYILNGEPLPPAPHG